MRFSAVIVNYASWPHTLRCVESLLGAGDPEIVVVDNDREEPPELPEGVRLLRNPENLGFARACNRGLRTSSGEIVVFVNPDVIVERDFFERLGEFFRGAPQAGVAGPRIVDGTGALQLSARREVNLASGLLGRTSLLTRAFPKSRLVRRMFPAAGEPGAPVAVDWVSGACLAARREVLEELGGFDERFFMYFEDADLCRRARQAGWKVFYLPRVQVVHHTGASSGDRTRAILRLHKSAFLYHRKHGPHGPFGIYDLLVLLGLCARAGVRLAGTLRPQGE